MCCCPSIQADQKTDDMLACVAGYGGREGLLALWLAHTNTKYTHTQDKYQHQHTWLMAGLFASYVLGVAPDPLESL